MGEFLGVARQRRGALRTTTPAPRRRPSVAREQATSRQGGPGTAGGHTLSEIASCAQTMAPIWKARRRRCASVFRQTGGFMYTRNELQRTKNHVTLGVLTFVCPRDLVAAAAMSLLSDSPGTVTL
jgi:hypothetical protein